MSDVYFVILAGTEPYTWSKLTDKIHAKILAISHRHRDVGDRGRFVHLVHDPRSNLGRQVPLHARSQPHRGKTALYHGRFRKRIQTLLDHSDHHFLQLDVHLADVFPICIPLEGNQKVQIRGEIHRIHENKSGKTEARF